MTARKGRLRAVPSLVGKTGFDSRFDVASQVMAAGAQDIHVQVIVPLSGPGQDAWGQGPALADKAFGPEVSLRRLGESISGE